MPGSFQVSAVGGVPNTTALPVVRSFVNSETPYFEYPYALVGVTRNASGTALGNCVVVVYRTADDSVAARGVSDASGNYRLSASPSIQHYVVAYLAGSPDVAGTTANTLVGA